MPGFLLSYALKLIKVNRIALQHTTHLYNMPLCKYNNLLNTDPPRLKNPVFYRHNNLLVI